MAAQSSRFYSEYGAPRGAPYWLLALLYIFSRECDNLILMDTLQLGAAQPKKPSLFRRLWRSRWRWPVIIVLLIAGGWALAAGRSNTETGYVTAAVERRDLRQIVEAAGTVESTQAIDLSFVGAGPVASVPAKVGVVVKAGTLLASLASQKQEAQVAVAQGALLAAQADLQGVTSGASSEALAVAAQQVAQAQASLAAAESAQRTLTQQRDADGINWRTSLAQSVDSNLFVANRAADEAHNVLTNDEASDLFAITSVSDYGRVMGDDTVLHNLLAQVVAEVAAMNRTDDASLIATAGRVIDGLDGTQRLLSDTLTLLRRLYATVQFTQTELDALKTIVATQQTAASAGIVALDGTRSTLVNGNASYVSQLDAASSAVTAAQSALAVAQAQQRSTAAPARSFELAQAQARVAQAQGDLQRNVATLEDYRLRAPADGTITRVDVRVGEQAVAGQPAVSLLGSVPLQIKVKVAEADIAKVAVGQTATITLDAFGDSRPFTGGVAAVDQAPTLVDGVVYYNVTVMFIGDATDVKIGMSADVDILTAVREQVLVVPARAVRGRAAALYVQVPRATGDPEERTVTIGLRGEDGLVEVLSGLTEGEQVVTLNRPAP